MLQPTAVIAAAAATGIQTEYRYISRVFHQATIYLSPVHPCVSVCTFVYADLYTIVIVVFALLPLFTTSGYTIAAAAVNRC